MSEKDVSEMSFEEALAELDAVVRNLESGSVALDKSIELYERGAHLKARCEQELKRAEEKIGKIQLDGDGNPNGIDVVKDL